MQNCIQCGAENSSGSKTCQTCGAQLEEPQYLSQPSKDNTTLWLVLNIICALCCCQILGIIGAVYAGLAKTSYRQENYGDAEHKIQVAKTLFWVGVVVGGILTIILVLSRNRFGY